MTTKPPAKRRNDSLDWRLAACRGEDPALFFPGKTGNASTVEAKRICGGCPIRDDCLTEALAIVDTYAGIRGGLSAEERRQMQVGRARVDHTADIIRLTGKRWPPAQIAARYGIDTNTVYRALKAHRAKRQESAA